MKKLILGLVIGIIIGVGSTASWAVNYSDQSVQRVLNSIWDQSTHSLKVTSV